ncbi:hypothetical protein JCM10450v2_006191 [Rhodotorula kratochvilovae]
MALPPLAPGPVRDPQQTSSAAFAALAGTASAGSSAALAPPPPPPAFPSGVPAAFPPQVYGSMHPPQPAHAPPSHAAHLALNHHNATTSSWAEGAASYPGAYDAIHPLPGEQQYYAPPELPVPLYAAPPNHHHHHPLPPHQPGSEYAHLPSLADAAILGGAYTNGSALADFAQAFPPPPAPPPLDPQHQQGYLPGPSSALAGSFPPPGSGLLPLSPTDTAPLAGGSAALDDPQLPPPPGTARRRHSRGGVGEPGVARGIGGRSSAGGESLGGEIARGGSASAAAAATGGETARRASVNALAAAVGTRTTEKSCKNCRVRKVKCDRKWPRCHRCKDRGDECDFGTFVPVDAIPEEALSGATTKGGEVAALQARIAALEAELTNLRTDGPAPAAGAFAAWPGGSSAFPTPHTNSARGSLVQQVSFSPLSGGGASSGGAYPALEGMPRAGLNALDDRAAGATLSETIHDVFSGGAGLARGGAAAQAGLKTVEIFLRGVALQEPEVYAVASAGLGPLMGPEGGQAAALPLPPPSESDVDWKLARGAMAKMLVVHLVQSFFASCCAYLPAFDGWHTRRTWVLHNIDNLDPASRVAVAAFCAMGARASQHSAILGISLPSPSPNDWFEQASAAGVRREQACRALHAQAMDLVHILGLTYDVSRENLEALMVLTQLLIFNELVPRRSRGLVLSALGQYKELQDSAMPPEAKDDTLKHIGLPLLVCDAITAAYARKKPLITRADLAQYFPSFVPPDPHKDGIQTVLQKCLRDSMTADGKLSHDGVRHCADIVHAWLAQAQRLFAQAAAPQLGGPPMSLIDDIRDLWQLLDQIHEGIRQLQEMLVHLNYAPAGCSSDGCADQHLRFITRLDKDLLDCFFLVHSLVTENLGLDSLVGENAHVVYAESDKRIRKALKLVAFYLELYITSRDPHMTYHVIFQLEILPNWTLIAVQRYGEPDGPSAPELEVSETELDWFDKGLVCASYYHPVANARLQELRQARRPTFQAPQPRPVETEHPPLAPLPSGLGVPAPNTGGSASAHAHALYYPAPAAYLTPNDPAGAHTAGGAFQGGVTDPAQSRAWGTWAGDVDVTKTG